MSRICRIVLVCEDWRSSRFARGFLSAANIDERCVDAQTNPGGSGHDWVKAKFADEVANLGRFAEGRGVLGLLDEDGQGAAVRENEVVARLAARGLPSLAAHEGRCLLLPARNIETWLYWLTGQTNGESIEVNETTDYKRNGPPDGIRRMADADCLPAGAFLHTLNHTRLSVGCPPMLGNALIKLREFLDAVRR